MRLTDLLKAITDLKNPETLTGGSFEKEITSIHYNSKDVRPGGLFVAIRGLKADGHNFIEDAIKKGASAIIAGMPVSVPGIPVIITGNSRKALAAVSAAFYDNPSSKMFVIGVTGTNGKTTTTYLIESILKRSGHNTGVIGTINYRFDGREYPNPMTTPESLDLQKILSMMKKAGVTHVVMEISSHAIDLDRIYGCEIDTAVFTNLTQDHLDYHKTMDGYSTCKKRLFTETLPASSKKDRIAAVINCSDSFGKELAKILDYRVISFGSSDSILVSKNEKITIQGITATITTPEGGFEISAPATGKHNLENIMNAVGAALTMKIPTEHIRSGIGSFSVPGRLEKVDNNRGTAVFVDYAHTPDALENVLTTLRPLTTGKLICVFGCGGDRDVTKRPIMGGIAEKYSDIAIVTSDNPRTEKPEKIIEDILEGLCTEKFTGNPTEIPGSKKIHIVEPDRHKAIRLAVGIAVKGDTILIAGKGHETYQITNTGTIDFDDREEARKAFEAVTA